MQKLFHNKMWSSSRVDVFCRSKQNFKVTKCAYLLLIRTTTFNWRSHLNFMTQKYMRSVGILPRVRLVCLPCTCWWKHSTFPAVQFILARFTEWKVYVSRRRTVIAFITSSCLLLRSEENIWGDLLTMARCKNRPSSELIAESACLPEHFIDATYLLQEFNNGAE